MYKRLIPSILIQQGRLVKGQKYQDYRDAGAAATTARAHNHQGADELMVCDIEASRNQKEPDYATLKSLADECYMPLTIMGGINSIERAEKCMDIGADKIGLTTTAYDNPNLISKLAMKYGAQAVVLGLDVIKSDAGQFSLFDHRTKNILGYPSSASLAPPPANDIEDPLLWAQKAQDLGAGEIRLMMVDQEGMQTGMDLTFFHDLKKKVDIPIIMEGGLGSLDHIEAVYQDGVDAIGVGSMLVFSDANLVKIKQHMRTKNISIRR